MQVTIDFQTEQQAAMVAHALCVVAHQCQEQAAERGETRPTSAKLSKATACTVTADAIRCAVAA